MSRQQETQGVVLTGYHSNAELLAQPGLSIACPPSRENDPQTTRWDSCLLFSPLAVAPCYCLLVEHQQHVSHSS